MDRIQSIQLWNQLCHKDLGVDGNGDTVTSLEPLGLVALCLGIPRNLHVAESNISGHQAVARFLREWASSLTAVEPATAQQSTKEEEK